MAEGELHAWLDGALDQLGEERAGQVREHLRRCAACQQALVAEEAVRARANEVLAYASPRASEMPPLEALMERAKAAAPAEAPRRSRMSRAARLGWAASVVLALGAGWMAREVGLLAPGASDALPEGGRVRAPEGAAGTAVSTEASAPAEEAGADLAVAPAAPPSETAEGGEIGRVAGGRAAPAVADPTATAALERAVSDVAQSATRMEQTAPSNVVATAPPPAIMPAPPAAEPQASRALVGPAQPSAAPALALEEVVVTGGAAGTVTGSGSGRAANAPTRQSGARQERAASSTVPEGRTGAIGIQRARAESVGSGVPDIFVEGRAAGAAADRPARVRADSLAEADEDETREFMVPGLELLRGHWIEVVPGQPGVLRVLQRLPAGDTLEIRFVRSGPAEAAGSPLAAIRAEPSVEGWSRVEQRHRDGWIVARARMSEVELRAILGRIGQQRN